MVSEALTQVTMGLEAEAIATMGQALTLTKSLFASEGRTLEDISAYQMTLLNAGNLHCTIFKSAKKEGRVDANALQKALECYYTTLVVHRRIRKDIFRRCLTQLVDLFTNSFGEEGSIACENLFKLYPDVNKEMILGGLPTPIRVAAISFLIDVSASMLSRVSSTGSYRRIDATVDSMTNILKSEIKDGTYFSLSAFGNKFTRYIEPLRVGEKNRHTILERILEIPSITRERRTHFWAALVELATEMKTAPLRFNERPWIVALTDGGDNDSRREFTPERAKMALEEAGVTLIVVAVDMGQEYVDLLRRAVVEKPNYVIGTDSSNLSAAFQEGFRIADSGGDAVMESL